MARVSAKFWTAFFAILVVGAADFAGPLCRSAAAEQTNAANNDSWYSPITRGFSKMGHALDPKPSEPKVADDDAIALKSKSKPSAQLYVALGRLYEEAGNFADAEQEYKAALNLTPDHLGALLAYARLKEELGQKNEAIWLYQRAAKTHPKEPSVYNNMGLFYARQERLDEAVAAMTTAVQIAPKNPLYRNNIATVLVDQCRFSEAFTNLREVHSEAAAYYNLGYLLNKKGNTQAAMQNFALALRADPSLVSAQRWIEYLEKKTTEARFGHHPMAEGLRIKADTSQLGSAPEPTHVETPQNDVQRTPASLAAAPDRDASSMLPDAVRPRHLPPVPAAESESGGPSLPGMAYEQCEHPAAATAPLPPPSTNSAVRRLPEVK